MMNKRNILFIPFREQYKRIENGYFDALKYLGFNVILIDPKYKLNTKNIIKDHDIGYMILEKNSVNAIPRDLDDCVSIYVCDAEKDIGFNHTIDHSDKLAFNNKILIVTDDFDDHYLINLIRQLKINDFDFKLTKDNLAYKDIAIIPSLFQNIIVLSCQSKDLLYNLAFSGAWVLSKIDDNIIETFKSPKELFDKLMDIKSLDRQCIKNKLEQQFIDVLGSNCYCDILIDRFCLEKDIISKLKPTLKFDFKIKLEL